MSSTKNFWLGLFTISLLQLLGPSAVFGQAGALSDLHTQAEQGNAEAQFMVASLYADGTVLEQDLVEAAEWYRRSAEQGFAQSFIPLAQAYLAGEGVPQDFVSAHLWFNIAAARLTSGDRQVAIDAREEVQRRMSPPQIAEAQGLARSWRPTGRQSAQGVTNDVIDADRPTEAELQLRTAETLARLSGQLDRAPRVRRRSVGAYYGGMAVASFGSAGVGFRFGRYLAGDKYMNRDERKLFNLSLAALGAGMIMMLYGGEEVPVVSVSDEHISVGLRFAWGGSTQAVGAHGAN